MLQFSYCNLHKLALQKSMSGHNKWSKIKHKKAITDAKRGKIFSKLSQLLTIAARDGGGDPDMNPSLRMVVNKAKAASMPAANVKKAIEKGAGTGKGGVALETHFYEGFAPDQIGVIIECLTDSNNRSISELRQIFNDNGGIFGDPGSISWNYDRKGLIKMRPAIYVEPEKFGAEKDVKELDKEEVMMELMDVEGILDIQENEDEGNVILEIYTDPTKFGIAKDFVMSKEYLVDEAGLAYIPKNIKNDVSDELMEKIMAFVDAIEEYPDVVNVWTDLG